MSISGGDTDRISAGARQLTAAGRDVGDCSSGIRQAHRQVAAGAQGSDLAAAIDRFGAAYATYVEGIGRQLDALGTLASVTGSDILAATNSHRPGSQPG